MNNARTRGRRMTVVGMGLALAVLSACSPGPEDAAETPPSVETTPASAATDIRAALADQNLGVARDRARAAQTAFPGDPAIHLLAAEIEARLGNAGDSAAAFLRAMDTGLTDPAARLADPAFNTVRSGAPFAAVRARLRPVAAGKAAVDEPATPAGRRDTVTAGDVEIVEDANGARIRAGDLVLDTRN